MASGIRARQRSMMLRLSPSQHSEGDLTPDSTISEHHSVTRNENVESQNLSNSDETQKSVHAEADELNPLGQDVKEAITAMGRLESLGLQKQSIDFPKCIVLGQQSTGKSSVIEAISGIKTPRDTGTCTCCPLYITLQPSEDSSAGWSARISLQQDYDLDLYSRQDVEQQFHGWSPALSRRQIPFAETRSRTELEVLIRRAQSANLSPLENPEVFKNTVHPPQGAQRSKFSPNVVRIDISQPGLPTLNFYDLPGIISQAETEEEDYTVPLVKNLVAEYVKQPGCLILVTCDLSSDIANSTAASLAREHNATDRCIGVLTKPDLLPQGTPDKGLIDVLDGKRFRLGHKYFVVKNLDKNEIEQGYTHRDARTRESEFFRKGRWGTTLQRFQSRFGTLNLQTYLSKELARQTLDNIPKIYEQIETRLLAVEEELAGIPEIPSHSAVRTVSDVLQSFSSNVRLEIEGEHEHTEWRNIWEDIQKTFSECLAAMKPTMLVSGDLDKGIFTSTLPGRSPQDCIVIDSDGGDDDGDSRIPDTPETPSKKRKLEYGTPVSSPHKTPVKPRPKLPKGTPVGTSARTTTNRAGSARIAKASQPADFVQFKKRFILDEVMQDVNQKSKSKVPGQIHPKVKEAMMLSAFQHWQQPIDVFFDALRQNLTRRMQYLLDQHFQKWRDSELYKNAWAIVEEVLRNNFNEQQNTMAVETLNDEFEGPYIFFHDQFNREKATVIEKYRHHRQKTRFKLYIKEAEEHVGRELSQSEQDKIRKDHQKMSIIKEEPYTNEIDLISDITSYYNLASQRLHDKICMRIESKFFKQLRMQLRKELEDGLDIYNETNGPNIARRLLAESPQREMRRQELVASKKALLEGLKCLDDLRNKYQGGSSSEDTGSSPTNTLGYSASEGMEKASRMLLPRR